MRYLILIFIFLSVSTQKEKTDERLVNLFVKEWIQSNGSNECAKKYLDINSYYLQDIEKNKFLFEWFSLFSKSLKEEIDKNDGKYQIFAHIKNEEKDLIKTFNLKTDDFSGVYYLAIDNKIFNSIIVKNGKIISFCPLMNQGSRINIPWFINEPDYKSQKCPDSNNK